MPIDLYYQAESPPSRSVLMVAKHLNIGVNIVSMNVLSGDQFKPEFLEINPAHTVPTLVDEDLVLWESRAIMCYLCNQYSPDSSLYPSDATERASVDKWLQFDLGSLFRSIREYCYPMFSGSIKLDKEKEKPMLEALEVLDNHLKESKGKYICGSQLTLADISIINTIDFLTDCFDYDITNNKDFKFVAGWQARLRRRDLPYYREICEEGIDNMRNFIRSQIQANASNPASK